MARQPAATQKAWVQFMAKLAELYESRLMEPPSMRGIQMAQKGKVESRHTRALVNAAAVGPERDTLLKRRQMLARLLAQRTEREAERPGKWTSLVEQIVQQIEELDKDAHCVAQMAGIDLAALDPTAVAMEQVERFLYALDRAVSAQEVQRSEEKQAEDKDTGTDQVKAEGGENDHG